VHHAHESIFDGSHTAFYKKSPAIAALWDQAFTAHNAAILDGMVEESSKTSSLRNQHMSVKAIHEPDVPPLKRQRRSETVRTMMFTGESLVYRVIITSERVQMVCHGINGTSRVVAQWFPASPHHVVVSVSERRLRILSGIKFTREIVAHPTPTAEDDKRLMTEFERAIMALSGAGRVQCIYRSTQNALEDYGYAAFGSVKDMWVKYLSAAQ
jgi:hypothetical protein